MSLSSYNYFLYVLVSIYGLSPLFHCSVCLFIRQFHIIHWPCNPSPAWWSPSCSPLNTHTTYFRPPTHTNAPGPSLTKVCLPWPFQHHSPSSRDTMCSMPPAHTSTSISSMYLLSVHSSPAPWRAASHLTNDCGPAQLPQWLLISKLLCPPSAAMPSPMRAALQP